MAEAPRPLDHLVHSVRSACGTLINAAERMRRVPPAERREILSMMLPRAEKVVDLLRNYQEGGAGE